MKEVAVLVRGGARQVRGCRINRLGFITCPCTCRKIRDSLAESRRFRSRKESSPKLSTGRPAALRIEVTPTRLGLRTVDHASAAWALISGHIEHLGTPPTTG